MSTAEEKLEITWVEIKDLFCSPANPRLNDEAVDPVMASIRRFGWRQPIVAKASGEVIAGNTRLKAAMKMNLKEVPVVYFNGTDLEATAYAIADNRTGEFAKWDEPALAVLLEELRKEDALEGVGYTDHEIDVLVATAIGEDESEQEGQDDAGPPVEDAISKRGDLWILGEHKLMCGDSSSRDDMQKLMGDEKSALLSTDPPYGVEYSGAGRPSNEAGKDGGKDWKKVGDGSLADDVEIPDYEKFIHDVFSNVMTFCIKNAPLYMWHADRQNPLIKRVMENLGYLIHQTIIWVKPTRVMSYSIYHWRHEPCVFGWIQGNKPKVYISNEENLSTIWEVDWEGKKRIVGNEHPTQKPVRLFEIPMINHTRPGAVILEPFCGSGSQIIACEKRERKCRAMEISAPFVDCSIRRWQKITGKEAIHEESGETYNTRLEAKDG